MKFQVGDKVVGVGGWYEGKTGRVTKLYELDWIQVRFDCISNEDYKTDDNGHSVLERQLRHTTKLEKALK
jgi:ribosomal protein L24